MHNLTCFGMSFGMSFGLDAKKIDEPAQEKKRKHRRFFGEDSGTDYLPNTVKGRFKMAYMEAFDHVILQITSRFE